MSSNKRYIATVTFYCYGKDEKEAFKSAEKTTRKISKKEDNDAKIEYLHKSDFGSINPIKIDLELLKQL